MKVAEETERAVREFGLGAASHLTEVLPEHDTDYSVGERWELGADGHFRERRGRTPNLWVMFGNEWLTSLPGYDSCVAKLRSDPCLRRHLDHSVGTQQFLLLLEPERILSSLIYSMFDDEGRLTSADEKLAEKWKELVTFVEAGWVSFTTIAPVPYLVLPDFPLQLNDELVLDRLTASEVTRCCEVSVLQRQSSTFPFIAASLAIGLRRTTQVQKVIKTDADSGKRSQPPAAEGRFGHRPVYRDALVVDDLLSAMRLFKRTQVRAAGHASWTETPWYSGTSYRTQGQWGLFGGFELSREEVPLFLDLWNLLEQGASRFGFSVHRFNLAFERGLLADRIVDLVIAAESLFLGDLGIRDCGELRFRFALRAARFIEHPDYSEQDIFRVMRRAYDARSAVVHGGSPQDTALPQDRDAKLPTFIDAIEELVRLGLRKALSMKEEGSRLRQSDYWDGLLFTEPS